MPNKASATIDAVDTLDGLAAKPELAERLVYRETMPARPAAYADLKEPLPGELVERLASRGVARLWSHQAAAIDALHTGGNIVVATGTASGKSLCYQLPIVEGVVAGRRETALLIFPTKALAQDQLRSLRSWLVPGLKAVSYDGDTPSDDRTWARRNANVVLTNPEMLHMGILPSHQRWATFMMRLRYVVVDELHTLRGIFGSHVAHLLRRLQRVCEHYGSHPTFCFASATIGNPAELASTLCGAPVALIDSDGAPRSERIVACWQRPLLDEHSGARASANVEAGALLASFVRDGHQTLAFTRSRRGAELVAQYARRDLERSAPLLAPRVAAYRSGYRADERRVLESDLTSGKLLGVAATTALELGIDVGGLDAIVLNGFPGTLASLWQQAGRAGRTGRRSTAVLVAGDDQLDQWYIAHPTELTRRLPERAVVNPDNPFVLHAQVACAAHELPLQPADERWFGDGLDEAVRALVHDDLLKPRGAKMYWSGPDRPAAGVGLRSGNGVEYHLVDEETDREVGTVDDARVQRRASRRALPPPGSAVPRHAARPGQSRRLARIVRLRRVHATARRHRHLDRGDRRARRDRARHRPHRRGRGDQSRPRLPAHPDLHAPRDRGLRSRPPPRTLTTRACWYTVPLDPLLAAGLEPGELLGTVHAAEHGLIGLLPLFTICDRWDVGGVSMAAHPQTGEPTIFVYDGYPGGAGIAELAYAASRGTSTRRSS